jgi:adenylate cyclase
MLRVFRTDSTFSTIPVPLGISASELQAMLSKKFMVNIKAGYALYLREKGLGQSFHSVPLLGLHSHTVVIEQSERRIGLNEKPVLLQKRRFEQAGYTEVDKLDDIGREDNSYLSKIVYKPALRPSAGNVRINSFSPFFIPFCCPTHTEPF